MADRLFGKQAYSIYKLNKWRDRKQVDIIRKNTRKGIWGHYKRPTILLLDISQDIAIKKQAFCVSLRIQELIAITKTYLSLPCHQAVSSFAIQLFKRTETTCELVLFFACVKPEVKDLDSRQKVQKARHSAVFSKTPRQSKTFFSGGRICLHSVRRGRSLVDLNLYKICAHLQVPCWPMLVQSSPLHCFEEL